MRKRTSVFRGVMLWSYERGTLQYDIICALILAFIFLVPRSCFVGSGQTRAGDPGSLSREIQTELNTPAGKPEK